MFHSAASSCEMSLAESVMILTLILFAPHHISWRNQYIRCFLHAGLHVSLRAGFHVSLHVGLHVS